MKKTKIICTLGPASTSEKIIKELFLNGMNVGRFNFSHGDHAEHKKRIDMFRKVRDELKMPGAVLLDTKGPEIRTRNFENGVVTLFEGNKFVLTTADILGNDEKVSITYDNLPNEVKKGCKILIDDGKVELEVEEVIDDEIHCVITMGGTIKDKRGINIPSVNLKMPYLSDNDKSDLIFGIEQDVDYIAASFVRRKEDLIDLRNFLDYHGGDKIKIISKIECQEGIDNFDDILKLSDGIMVARGDMGVEVDYDRLPGIQKRFIAKCYQSGKTVITATQMLESMINNPTPTRAEISDVANAVFDGTSAIMLSGETANGKYPVLALKAMARIAIRAEEDAFDLNKYKQLQQDIVIGDVTSAISDATCTTAKDINAKAIIAVTNSGRTARAVSRFRPEVPIVAATPSIKSFHQLALNWGVIPVVSRNQVHNDDLMKHAAVCAKQVGLVENGDVVVITAGLPLGMNGTTNLLKVHIVGE